jgi:SulP family sulfate permease
MNLNRFIPSLEWIKNYDKAWLKGDLTAGLTVGVMLIPQGMAYAMLAGLPPIYGLYASTIPLIIYAIFGTSRQLAVGPVAMVSLLTASGVGVLAQAGTEAFIGLAILLAFMVGALQFLMGAFRLGFLVSFLSHPVISGFTSAAALIIGFSQLKHLLGIPLGRSKHVHEVIIQAIQRIGETNIYTFLIGLGGIAIILLIKRFAKAIPAQLVAVVFGIIVVYFGGFAEQGVKIVGEVPSGLPKIGAPSFNWENFSALIPVALTISLVSFMESIAVAKAIQTKHKNYEVSANQELVSLGLSNLFGSFFMAYPVTGGFSRTAVNDQAGAKTGLASIISAVLVILTLLFLTPLFYYLPNAILASVIMVAVFGLIDWKEAVHLWKADRQDFIMLIVTFVATLLLGIEEGIGVGVVLSLAMIIFRTAYPHHAELGKVPGTHFYRNISRFSKLEDRPDTLIMRFDAQLYFANIDHFRNALNKYIDKKKEHLKHIILNFDSVNNVDSSALHILNEIFKNASKAGWKLSFSGVKGPVRDKMLKDGFLTKVGEDNFYMSVQEAVDEFDGVNNNDLMDSYIMQSNAVKA